MRKPECKGDAVGFLGMEFEQDSIKKVITITQDSFIFDATYDEGLDSAPSKLTQAQETTSHPCALSYTVDHVHPEALFIASQLSSAAGNPGKVHVEAGLKGASKVGLTLGEKLDITPEIFVDASYIEDGKVLSQLGYCVQLNHVADAIHS